MGFEDTALNSIPVPTKAGFDKQDVVAIWERRDTPEVTKQMKMIGTWEMEKRR
jgi:hypothetical protein